MITGIAGNMESMLVEQWAYRETDEHRENLFHQQSICLAVRPMSQDLIPLKQPTYQHLERSLGTPITIQLRGGTVLGAKMAPFKF